MEYCLQSARITKQVIKSVSRKFHTDASDEDISDLRSDMEKLIGNKLLLFPAINKQIVEVQITLEDGKDNIVIISARVT